MKKTILPFLLLTLFFAACSNSQQSNSATNDSTAATASTVDPSKDWKFGVALWTFHDVDFPQALDKADSAGLKYIEPNTFTRAGAARCVDRRF